MAILEMKNWIDLRDLRLKLPRNNGLVIEQADVKSDYIFLER